MRSYSAIVIGAGPAGATAARRLAENGISTLLLERATIPRVKPCGGAITHRALPLLPPGGEALLKSHPCAWTFCGRNGRSVTLARNLPYSHIVERSVFDAWLTDRAAHAGVEVHDGEAVTAAEVTPTHSRLTTKYGRYTADIVIAADGAHGMMAKAAGFPRPRRGAAIEAEIPADAALLQHYHERVEIHVGQYPWGYAWVIPRAEILNIGVGSFRPAMFPLKERFFEFLERIVGHRDVVPLAHPLPYRLRWDPPVRNRVLFAGDAAGLMDAFSAEGIYSALKSGHMAADAALESLRHGTPCRTYAENLYEEFWPALKSAAKMSLLFYPLAGFWSDVFGQNQELLSHYLDVATGECPYDTLTRRAEHQLLHHPSMLLKRPRLNSAHDTFGST
ncbi:geranylgeranyl reductase family protein [Sulfobacillus harzensis]|uniref:NAD(P)/FAD-dependent oxidoreductase n=1 Tax=Sulfobacillus harzensis TaxID=2729629 RepID=UPI00308401D2